MKESLEPMFRQNIGQPNVGQPVQSVVVNQQTSQSRILPDYLQNVSSEIKLRVEELVDSLFHQGIEKVISRARRASPFILDAFHDALTDKLHEELKKKIDINGILFNFINTAYYCRRRRYFFLF